ncbi:MAG: ABC transporter permease, partial [Dehalococcoidia bacterium]|nr:ABC transporter permease [Dehalococcoidia bacterium]
YPVDPTKQDLLNIRNPPSLTSPFGTDDLGRDYLTRVMHGGRISLTVGLLATFVAITIGTIVGALAGFFGGWIDALLMRITDTFLAFPAVLILIMLSVLLAALQFTQFWWVAIVIGVLNWMNVARLVRAAYLQLREMEYVTAARAIGAGNFAIMVKHILPNSVSSIIVAATLGVGEAILAESTLSFLGLGVQPPTATWGNMLRIAQPELVMAPWMAIFPGLMIFLTILSINFVGDGLRDAFDPRRRV